MIKSVKVYNHLGESILLELGGQDGSGLLITDISGVSPGKATISTTRRASIDGSVVTGANIGDRNIVFNMRLVENPTMEITRINSYRYFPLKKMVRLEFTTDTRHCEIYGIVESNEPNIFSKQVSSQISIICPDPYFYSLTSYLTVFYGVTPMFEFPFENDSLTEKCLNFGEIQNRSEGLINYQGDIETGVVIQIRATGPATNISIYNTTTSEIMRISSSKLVLITGEDIKAGDEITISTLDDDLFIHLYRDGNVINIMNCLDKDADWFKLVKGDNIFVHTAETGLNFLQFKLYNKLVFTGL